MEHEAEKKWTECFLQELIFNNNDENADKTEMDILVDTE